MPLDGDLLVAETHALLGDLINLLRYSLIVSFSNFWDSSFTFKTPARLFAKVLGSVLHEGQTQFCQKILGTNWAA